MDAMTKEERELVNATREEANAASAGPWKVCGAPDCACGLIWSVPADGVVLIAQSQNQEEMLGEGFTREQQCKNARFAAHAREAAPALCDLAERLAAKVEQLEAELAGKRAGTS